MLQDRGVVRITDATAFTGRIAGQHAASLGGSRTRESIVWGPHEFEDDFTRGLSL